MKLSFSANIMAALIISVVAAWDEPSESEQNENRELSVMMDDLNVFAGCQNGESGKQS